MGRRLEDALELINPIMELQDEIDKVNHEEYERKFTLKENCKATLRWDEKQGCLRRPCITPTQESLFLERSEIIETLPRFWSTALSADDSLLRYMNEEEQEIMLKYLKSVHVSYHGGAKSGYTISFNMDINPHFENATLEKTFNFTREGIYCRRGTAIRWKTNEDTQSHTDMPSFFKWFAEDTHNYHDLVAEEILVGFWPSAHQYYQIGRKRSTEKLEDVDLSKLTAVSDKLQRAEFQASKEKYTMGHEQQLVLQKGEREVHRECESSRRQIYERRSEIIERIPYFWLIAFSSHYALHHLLSSEDRKIFRYLKSVDVEETEDAKGVVSGYTITLEFDTNPYFENDSLVKMISYTIVSINPLQGYTENKVNISVSDTHWKDGMDITSRNRREFTDTGTSFFTWFTNL
ncbi:hypothetical protein C5167_025704 [Papaver somniferum]|uniref:Uncharacterized protein n=1 Tax=Papaver somniferum TaxID=3469 RepID=A0A4Y7JS83_PAPSO|nr:hypothetical protein C5167_025704 [Papaver somniferum]